MKTSLLVIGFAALTLAACESRNLESNTGAGGAAGTGMVGTAGTTGTGGTGGCPTGRASPANTVPAEHRAAPKMCSPTDLPALDGGAVSCTTDADCTMADGGNLTGYNTCLHGVCSFDHCFTDDDCGGGVCACSTDYYGGNVAYRPNVCVSGNCRVDADCGVGGYCSPTRGYCGSFEGFYCHGPADSCVDATIDCAGCGTACVYSTTAAAFVCGGPICQG